MLDEFLPPLLDTLWRELARQLGASYEPNWFYSWGIVRLQHRQWTIALDIWKGGRNVYTTRVRARFFNRDGFWFTVYPQGVVSTARKWLGMQDITVGHPGFDEQFIVQGNNEARLAALFGNPR